MFMNSKYHFGLPHQISSHEDNKKKKISTKTEMYTCPEKKHTLIIPLTHSVEIKERIIFI